VTRVLNKRGSEVISGDAYAYYLNGNQAAKTDQSGIVTYYEYDEPGRLVSENNGEVTWNYEYDKAGNRKKMTVSGEEYGTVETSYQYDKNNRLTGKTETLGDIEISAKKYYYDNNGNQVSVISNNIGSRLAVIVGRLIIIPVFKASLANADEENGYTYELFEYDAFNRLVRANISGAVSIYGYKADGLRLYKETAGERVTHVWDGGGMVLEVNADKTVKDRYVRGINLIKSDENGFYLYNAHGDVIQLADESGAVTKDYRYDAFGVEIGKDESDGNPWRYCGEYWDEETGTV
jgi:YD repeat-containing protein